MEPHAQARGTSATVFRPRLRVGRNPAPKTTIHPRASPWSSGAWRKIVKCLPGNLKKKLPRVVHVTEISSAKSAQLNRIYRREHKPANVLSFRYGKNYGEILVCPALIRREAKVQRKTYPYQMTWMVVHGMLHLAGLHHESSMTTATRIEKLERKILGNIFKKTRN